MDLHNLIDVFLHLDKHLNEWATSLGGGLYGILFAIVFCETGLVVTPFLPGDWLLFAAGAVAALGTLSPIWLIFVLFTAPVLGDNANYWVGHFLGKRLLGAQKRRFIRREHLERTEAFYERHGP